MMLVTYSHGINQFEGTFACSCDFGYEGDGYHCIDHDECEAGDHLCPGPSQESGLHTSMIEALSLVQRDLIILNF